MKKCFFGWILKAGIILAALSILSCTGRGESASDSDMATAFASAGMRLLSQTVSARDFTLRLLSASEEVHEETITLSDLRGSVVFVKFWATWCGPCRAGMPSMQSLYDRFKDENFEMLAVNIRESDSHVHAFVEDSNLSFTVLLDSDARVSASFGVQSIPATFLINQEGQIIARFIGNLDWDSPQFHTALEMLLDI